MTKIIEGKLIAAKRLADLKGKILAEKSSPALAIILVGDNPASLIYVDNKLKAAKEAGISAELFKYDDDLSEDELLNVIHSLNRNKNIHGIIVQLPLPQHINASKIISEVDVKKDVDGFNPLNIGLLYSGQDTYYVPCTPLGILNILKTEVQSLEGLHAVIIGRSNIVGKPLASLLLKENMTVTICHSKTKNLEKLTNLADVVITASGATESFGREYFNEKSIIIDVGINKNKNGQIRGDVKFEELSSLVKAITKVPGGVGPMTVISLLENCYKAYLYQQT